MKPEYHKVRDAVGVRMIQLFRWLPNTEEEIEWLEKEHTRINKIKGRKAMLIKSRRGLTLFVNKVADV